MLESRHSRRLFLRGAGALLALPIFEQTILRRVAQAADAKQPKEAPRRLLCINTTLGLHTENLFPKQTGKEYEPSPYLDVIKDFRNDYTVFSGLSHPDVDGGHSAEASYLTAAPHPRSDSFKNTISLDQFAVERLAPDTRFSSLVLSSSSSRGLSHTRNGVAIPAQDRPSTVFKKMFVEGTPAEVRSQVDRLSQGESVIDTVLAEAHALERGLGKQDREKLAEYFAAVRDVELRLQKAQAWAKQPKPAVEAKIPVDVTDNKEVAAKVRLMVDLMCLAFKTDSTRFITFAFSGMNAVPKIEGVSQDWHNLSHHGQDPAKLAELKIIELEQMKLFGELLAKLRATPEVGGNLLNHTTILFGSNLGNASSHSNINMPIVVAGGGYRHGQHLAFDPKKNPPLSNLYVQMLQRLGLDIDSFGSSTGTIPGFELA
ncbi:hypothetical protein ETAA8_28060 [Anatilimnocola aggregata]|uniref:DUF1552 domain-containing protein n=1 Tax=Anatilimnocola aggregata TaxID=2528021 RepID=A0A517YBU6_9BACT|nr:DUF1552 domain-containing protein [Anatilimnocola aggregata]QDU27717.1 hypothetical protein ETAA8_28060 [Anatilimnocola aggregata]